MSKTSKKKPFLLGVTGGSASGKSYAAQKLTELMPGPVTLIHQDAFYRPLDPNELESKHNRNMDCPDAFDWPCFEDVLKAIRLGQPFALPIYNHETYLREGFSNPVRPTPLVIVEGILLLHDSSIHECLDHVLYIDASEQLRVERRVRRDQKERGRDVKTIHRQLDSFVLPMHRKYVEPNKAKADSVLTNDSTEQEFTAALESFSQSLPDMSSS